MMALWPTQARTKLSAATAIFGLWIVVAPAALIADEVRIGSRWHRHVTIQEVQDGTIVYTDNFGNERVKSLEQVRALKIPTFADLGRAHDALDAGEFANALTLFARVQKQVRRPPWLKHWIQWQTMIALARSGRAAEAVAAYVELDRVGADAFYLSHPPTTAVGGADDRQKRDVQQRLADAMTSMRPEARAGAETMLRRITASNAPPPDRPKSREDGPAEPDSAPPAVNQEQPSAVVLPKAIVDDDQTTMLLRAGKFEEALKVVGQILNRKNVARISMRWYQRGVASTALADSATDSAKAGRLYRDAGLDFMRVVVYFPTGVYRAPALVEAGYIHHRIGQPRKAKQLYAQATQGIRAIEQKLEPKIYQRLQQLLKAVNQEPNASDRR